MGPPLRLPLAKFCLLTLSETTSLVLGGLSGGETTSDNVYVYDWYDDRWDKFTTLFEARHSAMCRASVDPGSGRVVVDVAGGVGPGGGLKKSVETFTFNLRDSSIGSSNTLVGEEP